MAINMAEELAVEAAKTARLREDFVVVVFAEGSYVMRITGVLPGMSIRQAVRRRQRIMSGARKACDRLGLKCSIVLAVEDAQKRLEDAVLALLRTSVNASIDRVDILVDRSRVALCNVRLGGDRHAPDTISAQVFRVLEDLFVAKGLLLDQKNIKVQGIDANMPSLPSILRALKIGQPCTAGTLLRVLAKLGFDSGDERWLLHQLDRARIAGLVRHVGNGDHCLTLAGLQSVPVGTSRGSSDVLRALDLGRRRW